VRKIACPTNDINCIVGTLFTEINPPCGNCHNNNLSISGITYKGEQQTIIVTDYGFEYTGNKEDIESIRKCRCLNGNKG